METGELVAIVGQSGAGKSTLLHILGALDAPSAGTVYCASTNVAKLTPRQAAAFRNREIGYVWQSHYLLPEFTAQENVAMPLLARGQGSEKRWISAAGWLREVGLDDRRDHRPGELSGGEQQRVALARALVNHPRLLLADEPTGDLDESTARQVFDLIQRIHTSHGLTSILVTHNMELAATMFAGFAPGTRPAGINSPSSNAAKQPWLGNRVLKKQRYELEMSLIVYGVMRPGNWNLAPG